MSDSYANPLRAPAFAFPAVRAFPHKQPIHNYLGDRWVHVDPKRPVWAGACCYVFLFDGMVIYVGSTGNFRLRLSAHRSALLNDIDPERLSIKIHRGHRYGDWLMREARLIRRLQPRLNCVGSVRPRRAA